MAKVIESVRTTEPHPLLVDLGDFTGDPIEGGEVDGEIARRERGRITLEALGLMGYDALVPGERDLTLGVEDLQQAASAAGINLLGTNLELDDPAEALGLRELWLDTLVGQVALVGISAPLDELQLEAAARGHGRPLRVTDPRVSLRDWLPELEQQAALVVILAHGPTDWARGLLAALDGQYVMIVAHDEEAPAW